MSVYTMPNLEEQFAAEERLDVYVGSLFATRPEHRHSAKSKFSVKQVIAEIAFIRENHSNSEYKNLSKVKNGKEVAAVFPTLKDYL